MFSLLSPPPTAEAEAEEPAAETDHGPTAQPHLGDQLHAGCQELRQKKKQKKKRRTQTLTRRATGYHGGLLRLHFTGGGRNGGLWQITTSPAPQRRYESTGGQMW